MKTFDDLVGDYLAGGDAAEVDRLVARDPAMARRFVQLALVHGGLRVARPRRRVVTRRRPWRWIAAAAACVAVALVATRREPPKAEVVREPVVEPVAHVEPPPPSPVTPLPPPAPGIPLAPPPAPVDPPPPPPPPPRPTRVEVAKVVRTGEIVCAGDAVAGDVGLAMGDTFIVLRGRARVHEGRVALDAGELTADGTLVVETPETRVEARPCHFRVRTADAATRVEVDRGALDVASTRIVEGRAAVVARGALAESAAFRVLWTDRCDATGPWRPFGFEPLSLRPDDDSAWAGRRHFRLSYVSLGTGDWALDVRTIARAMKLSPEATHVRFWVRPLAATAKSTFHLRFRSEDTFWGKTLLLADLRAGRWNLVELPLASLTEFYRRKEYRNDPSAAPPDPKIVTHLEIGACGGDSEVSVDDIQVIRR
jgi:hypothetical protein